MDRWLFLLGVAVVCCIIHPPFLGLWIGIGIIYAISCVVSGVINTLIP